MRGEHAPAKGENLGECAALRAELEAFGITPARAVALVEAYPAEHVAAQIAYVRGLVSRRRPGAPGLRNPAGFLARAIEQSYTIPQHEVRAAPPAVVMPAVQAPPLEPVAGRAAPAGSSMAQEGTAAPPAGAQDGCAAAEEPGSQQGEDTAALSDEAERLWAPLAAALKARLSAATYAAWVAPVRPEVRSAAAPEEGMAGSQAAAERGAGAGAGSASLVLVVPSAFALDRWRRPPIAPALEEAAGAMGVAVSVEAAAPRPEAR